MRAVVLLLLTYLGFISLGLPDGMLGVAWPFMRQEFGLPLDAVGPVLFVATAGYLFASLMSGRVLGWITVPTLLAASCAATSLSLFGFAAATHWPMIVSLALLAGLGAGAIDAGLNTYAATRYSARTLTWLHACFGLGAASGPLLLSAFLSRGASWQSGYATVAGGQLVLAAAFMASSRWWTAAEAETTNGSEAAPAKAASFAESLRLRTVWLGIATFLVYTGLEAAVGTWAFTMLTEQHAMPAVTAGRWAGAYWGSLAVGRIVAGMMAPHVSQRALLRTSAALTAGGALLTMINLGATPALIGILLVGLGCAPIFPSLIALTPERVGQSHAANTVGFQIAAATLGQSLLPASIGWAAQRHGLPAIGAGWSISAIAVLMLVFALSAKRAG